MSAGSNKQMRDLFAAARRDGPDAATRDALWDRLAVATGISSAAAAAESAPAAKGASSAPAATKAASSAPAAGSASAVKLVAVGVAVGALGTALGVVVVGSAEPTFVPRAASRIPVARAPAHVATSGARRADGEIRGKVTVSEAPVVAEPAAVVAPAVKTAPREEQRDAESMLAEEARLLTEARRALVRGEPARALALLDDAKRLPVRALQPEQMGIEARALRASGRADEAAAVELRLRATYPEHALAR